MRLGLIIYFILLPVQLSAAELQLKHILLPKIEYRNCRVTQAVTSRFIRKYFRSFAREDYERAFLASESPGTFWRDYPQINFRSFPRNNKKLISFGGLQVLEDLRFRVDFKELFGEENFSRAVRPAKNMSSSLVSFRSKVRANISFHHKRVIRALGCTISKTYKIYSYRVKVAIRYKFRFKNQESQLTLSIGVLGWLPG